jgi:PAS domain S-box-containing protein
VQSARRLGYSLVVNRTRRKAPSDVAGALRYHSEERFRLLVESVKDYAIFMLDCDGLVVSWNAGAERITGYAASEVVGAHFSRFYAPEARETQWPQRELASAARDGRAEDEGWRFGKGGERFWAHTVITALRDADGTLRGYACIFRDLSDRRRQEEQLAQNEQRLRALLASVRDYAIIMLDPHGTVVSWSEGAEQIEGYRSEEIIGAHFSRFFPPEAIERGWPEHVLRVAATEGHFEDENWRVRKDGSRFWANVVITALRDRNAKLIGFSKITRDLTGRRQQEEALRESQERFRLLIESVKEYAIYMLDASGHVMSWNAGAQAILGFEAGEIMGKHFSRFYLPEEIHSGKPWQQLENARHQGRLELEGLRVRKDGAVFNAQVLIAPVHDSEGRLRGYSHITHDLTRLRHMRALEDSFRRMNEFLAVLSHELRNPLAPLRHAVALLQRIGHTEPQVDRLTDIIDHQTTHLSRVIDDLLDVSRIAHGLISIARERVTITTIVDRAVELTAPQIERRHHTLHVGPIDSSLAVDGDLVRLTQVVAILLDNAAKYTPEGGHIRLEMRRVDGDVELSVRDNGRGISAERLAMVFDFFAQADRSAAHTEGLGVGLGLARRLVELHGGRIVAHSDGVDRGSVFTVTLPLCASANVAVPAEREDASEQPAESTRSRRILVVDDNVDSATSLVMLLQAMGYETDSAHDGIEALETAERFAPDTVLLDIGLPRLNGYEVARRLRERAGDRYLLVALTGWGQQEDRERARDAGFDHHLVKPVDLEKLGRILGAPTQVH